MDYPAYTMATYESIKNISGNWGNLGEFCLKDQLLACTTFCVPVNKPKNDQRNIWV